MHTQWEVQLKVFGTLLYSFITQTSIASSKKDSCFYSAM